jgi:hypothetical protein
VWATLEALARQHSMSSFIQRLLEEEVSDLLEAREVGAPRAR